jgi:cellulose synthase/poly-beta-1,6-N-acetylglucosamine synthase-like glycosyltransferase
LENEIIALKFANSYTPSMIVFSVLVLLVAMLPALMFLKNSTLFTKATREPELLADVQSIPVSILIPARNEAASIIFKLPDVPLPRRCTADYRNWNLSPAK